MFGGGCALGAEVMGVFVAGDAWGLGPDVAFFLGEVLEFGLESAQVLFKVYDLYVLDIDGPPGLM